MKTMMKFFMLAAAAVAAISCAKEFTPEANETPAPDVKLVPMTFNASSEDHTKVVHDGNGIIWESDDKIAIISGTNKNDFQPTEIDGSRATFTGWTTEAENHYAVYPASAVSGVTAEGVFDVLIPAEQTAVHGSFDPSALVAVAKADSENNLVFMNIVTMVKFRLSNPENVKSVRFTAVNNNGQEATLASIGTITADQGLTTHQTKSNSLKMVTLKAPDDGFKAETDYYLVFRINDCRKGFTFYFEYNDGTVKKRSTSNALFGDKESDFRNQVRNLKTIDVNLTELTPYDAYQMGYDINIAGRTYNKTKLGDATKISNPDFVISENGVYFIDETATNLKVHKDGTLNKLYIIANKNDQKLPITFGRDLRYGKNGTVALKNMAIAPLTTTELFIHNNANEISTLVALDGCKVAMSGKSIITNANTRTVDTFLMHNCDVEVNADGLKVIAAGDEIKNVEFVNNIFYSATDRKNFKLYDILSGATSNVTNFKFISNSFINVYLNPNGLITPSKLTGSFVNEQNLFEYPNYMTVVNSTYRTMLRCGDAVENYPAEADFKWAAGWFYIGGVETPDSRYSIKSSYKVVNDAVSPQNSSGFKSLSFDPVLTFTKAYSAGATR